MSSNNLRDYQVSLLERVRTRIAQGYKRILVQAATGAGKTHISSAIFRSAYWKGTCCLFLAHRRRLIEQKAARLDLFGVPYGILMSGHRQSSSQQIQIVSRDTLLSRACRNQWITPPPADLIIVDECRNCMSDEYQHLLSLYPKAVIIGLDATPARADGRGLGDYFEVLECAVPTSQLVAEGHLVPVRVYAPLSQKQNGKNGKGKRVLAGDPVEHWKRHAEGRPTVAFCSRVKASLALVAAFNGAGIKAEHIDGNTSDTDRDAVIRRVEAGVTKIVSNVGIWIEGVDVPCLSACIMMCLASSYAAYAQRVGRIMRPYPGKTDAVLLDHSGAVFLHGMPTDDVPWSLDVTTRVEDRKKEQDEKKPGDARPIFCEGCGLVFTGKPVCPACGWRLVPKGQAALRQNELLAEITESKSPAQQREEKWRAWQKWLAIAYHQGRTCGAAAAMFRKEVGDWPTAYFTSDKLPYGEQWKQKAKDVYKGRF